MRPSPAGARQSEAVETDSPGARPSDPAETDPASGEQASARKRRWLVWVRRTVSVGLIVGGVVAAYGRRQDIRQAVDTIGNPAWGWLLCACVTQASSMVAFARLQRWLLHTGGIRVRLRDMVEITLAGNAMSTSLPGGAAWAAGWVWGQLRRRQVDRVLAGWVVLVAGALASFALFLLVVIGAFIAGSQGPATSLRWLGVALLAVGALAAGAVVSVVRSDRLGRRWQQRVADASVGRRKADAVVRGADRFGHRVRVVTPSPLAWLEALGLALYNWVADLLTLFFVILTVHGHVPWRGIVVAYALTQIAASIPITPGGLAVVEASLTALLTAYGMPAAEAITVVLLYRLVSFWALVPIGWASWGYLEALQRRQSQPAGQRRHHPWAEHRHVRIGHRGPRGSRGLRVSQGPQVSQGRGVSQGPGVSRGLRVSRVSRGGQRERGSRVIPLDAVRGPEHLVRPEACEECTQNGAGEVGVAGAVGATGTAGTTGTAGVAGAVGGPERP